ncbi:MAG: choice-of-anchor J domain-containing protein [Chitinophagaceae bacterium]
MTKNGAAPHLEGMLQICHQAVLRNGVQINGFLVTNIPNEDWLITPSFNLTGTAFPLLSFWSRTAFNGAPLQLKISTDYPGTGDPRNYTWTDLNGRFPNQTSDVWTLSGNINLSAFKQPSVFIAFVYTSSSDDGARWTLDDIKIENSATPPPPALSVNSTDMQFTFVASGSTADKTFTFIGNDLTADVTLTSAGTFLLSKDGTTFSSSITYSVAEANNISRNVFVRFAPTQSNQDYTGTVTIATSPLSAVVNLKGTSIDPATTLEVVNWNVEWFGSTSFGPTNDNLQEQNAKTILQNIGTDIYGLVEVVDEARLARVVSQMPGYSYIIGNYGSHVNPPDPTGESCIKGTERSFCL